MMNEIFHSILFLIGHGQRSKMDMEESLYNNPLEEQGFSIMKCKCQMEELRYTVKEELLNEMLRNRRNWHKFINMERQYIMIIVKMILRKRIPMIRSMSCTCKHDKMSIIKRRKRIDLSKAVCLIPKDAINSEGKMYRIIKDLDEMLNGIYDQIQSIYFLFLSNFVSLQLFPLFIYI